MERTTRTIPVLLAGFLSNHIKKVRTSQALKLSQEQLAGRATLALAKYMSASPDLPTEELSAWEDLEITTDMVRSFENGPYSIMGSHRRRGALFAICLELRLDVAKVNRWAGGLPEITRLAEGN